MRNSSVLCSACIDGNIAVSSLELTPATAARNWRAVLQNIQFSGIFAGGPAIRTPTGVRSPVDVRGCGLTPRKWHQEKNDGRTVADIDVNLLQFQLCGCYRIAVYIQRHMTLCCSVSGNTVAFHKTHA